MPRLTAAGWLVAGGGVALLAAGRLFGLLELFILGAGALSLVGSAALVARRRWPRVVVQRDLATRRVHAGTSLGIRVEVTNQGSRRTPVIELSEPVGARSARLLVPPLLGSMATRSQYRLHAPRRGRLRVGPMRATAVDPFGLARSQQLVADTVDVVVLPQVHLIRPLPRTPALDSSTRTAAATRLVGAGGEFHSLAQYQPGDDLRRVHWPSSMRRDELLVRIDEQPWDGVTTVVLDDASSAPTETYESAVTAAASIVVATARAGHRCRLLTSSGHDSGLGHGREHADRLLRHLALVEPGTGRWTTALIAAGRAGGAVAVVSPVAVDPAAVRRSLPTVRLALTVAPGQPIEPGPGFVEAWDAAALRARTAGSRR